MYGVNDANKTKAGFAKNCLLARRLIERGVRFVQLFNGAYAMGEGVGNWDGHKQIAQDQYDVHGPILDQPCAALLKDLKARGLLDETLSRFRDGIWPNADFPKRRQRARSQSARLYRVAIRRGRQTRFQLRRDDEFGYKAEQNIATIYDCTPRHLALTGGELRHNASASIANGIESALNRCSRPCDLTMC